MLCHAPYLSVVQSLRHACTKVSDLWKFRICPYLSNSDSIHEIHTDFIHVNRKGSRLGHDNIIDGMVKDGLWDVYNDFGMGVCAELCAEQHTITREEQVIFLSKLFPFFIHCISWIPVCWTIFLLIF